MFYLVYLERDVDLEPRMFGKNLVENLQEKVMTEAQGKVDPNVGYIINVSEVNPVGKGAIRSDGSGYCTFKVAYKCIAMRLWVGEVVDAEVTEVHKLGFTCKAGPHTIFVSEHYIPDDFVFKSTETQPLWSSEDGTADAMEIREHSEVRVRVLGSSMDPHTVRTVASMKGDYLGVINI